jgi:hypothetical protein
MANLPETRRVLRTGLPSAEVSWQQAAGRGRKKTGDLRKTVHEGMGRLKERLAASDGGTVNSSMDRDGK